MTNKILMKLTLLLVLILVGSPVLTGVASAVTYNLTADVTTKTMPDGTTVTMWGFGCTDGTGGCPNPGVVTVPGPQITVPPGDTTLIINLTNNLPEATSIVIPGLIQTSGRSPQPFITDSQTRDRKTSFANVATALGGSRSFTWTVKPGTYLYQSGTHPQVQVQMGLYGAVVNDSASGDAYGGATATTFNSSVPLIFSEIDPVVHAAVAGQGGASYGPAGTMTSTIDYFPKYFLINGTPYSAEKPPVSLGSLGDRVILRFLNAGLRELVPVINGIYMTLVAEDGNPYTFPKTQYSILLAPGKTIDAMITNPGAGYYPLYERRLGTTNAGATGGGMMLSLQVAGVAQFALNVTTSGTGNGTVESASMPGGINCSSPGATGACSASYNTGTEIRLAARPAADSGFLKWTGACTGSGDCVVTMDAAKSVNAIFRLKDRIGIFRDANGSGRWYLDNGTGLFNGCGAFAVFDACLIPFGGMAGDIPVAGDWNGDGITKIGIYRNGAWHLDNGTHVFPVAATVAAFGGVAGDIPVVGDWNGNGTTKIGIYRNGAWYLDDGTGTFPPTATIAAFGGQPGDIPVTGDWNGDGVTDIGIYRYEARQFSAGGYWYLDNGTHTLASVTPIGPFGGLPQDIPVTGDWSNDKKTDIGIYRVVNDRAWWYLDNGSHIFNALLPVPMGPFGGWLTDRPVTGHWY